MRSEGEDVRMCVRKIFTSTHFYFPTFLPFDIFIIFFSIFLFSTNVRKITGPSLRLDLEKTILEIIGIKFKTILKYSLFDVNPPA